MKKRQLCLLTIILLILTPGIIQANNGGNSIEIKSFGVGLHMQQFTLSDISSEVMVPANKLLLLYSTNLFRVEPEFAFFNYKYKESKSRGLFFGLGLFGMYQIEQTNIYYGVRTGFSFISMDDVYYDDDMTRFEIGPAVGAEYFFSNYFSIGGEISIRYSSIDSGMSENETMMATNTGLLLRFYF